MIDQNGASMKNGSAMCTDARSAATVVLNPATEADYWRDQYPTRPYAQSNATYEDFAPAYRMGWERASRPESRGQDFESVEFELSRRWDYAKGRSHLVWGQVKHASRDAWNRVQLAGTAQATHATNS